MWLLGNKDQSASASDGERVSGRAALAAIWLADLKRLLLLRRNNLAQQWGVPASLMEDMPPQPNNVIQVSDGGWLKGLLAGAGVLGGILAGSMLFKGAQPPPPGPVPADSAYKVLFYDRDGKPIRIPHLDERPK